MEDDFILVDEPHEEPRIWSKEDFAVLDQWIEETNRSLSCIGVAPMLIMQAR